MVCSIQAIFSTLKANVFVNRMAVFKILISGQEFQKINPKINMGDIQ